MKKLFVVLVALLLLVLIACSGGGGGGDNSATPTAKGTAVNISSFKDIYTGTAATGSGLSFSSLKGSDSEGKSWTGSLAIISDGSTTFESQDVTKSRTMVTLAREGSASVNGITSRYFLASDGSFYKSISSLGITCLPIIQGSIPDVVHVGDFGDLGTSSCSDGDTKIDTWRLDAEYDGNSKLVLSTMTKNASDVVISLEDDTFYLDATGNPYRHEATVTSDGITLTLSGNKD